MARLRLALLRNMSGSFKVVDKSVRNFDMESYHRGNPKGFSLFFVVLFFYIYDSRSWGLWHGLCHGWVYITFKPFTYERKEMLYGNRSRIWVGGDAPPCTNNDNP